MCGILVESVTLGRNTTTVAGIGINVASEVSETSFDFKIGYAEWYDKSLTREYLINQLHCRISGLFEEKLNLPNSTMTHYFESMKMPFLRHLRFLSRCSRNKKIDFLSLNKDSAMLVRDVEGKIVNVLDGEELNWIFS